MVKSISKLSILMIVFVVALAMYIGCSNNDNENIASITDTAETETYAGDKPEVDNITDWKTAYKDYFESYSPVMGYITIGLVDFNTDEQPELIILDDSHGTLQGRYTIISYQNGEVVEICTYGTSSFITEVEGNFYFYRTFNSIHDSGGMYGYGFVSQLECSSESIAMTNLLESSIDYSYDESLDILSWELTGEENILKNAEFNNYFTIQKWADDTKWQIISADEYISIKNTYLGVNPSENIISDYFKIRLDFFDTSDNTYPITQNELNEFFNEWNKFE